MCFFFLRAQVKLIALSKTRNYCHSASMCVCINYKFESAAAEGTSCVTLMLLDCEAHMLKRWFLVCTALLSLRYMLT